MTRVGGPAQANDAGASAPMTPPVSSRYEGVQALRFVASLLVVITHSTYYAQERLNARFPIWEFGVVGVEIFFIVSGFVMMMSTRSLQKKPGAWKYFSMRRIVRIVPMYWIATTTKILTMIVVPGAVLHAALTPGSILFSYFFLPSRNVDGHVEPLLGVGWTLTFEMFFYLIFAIALLVRANTLLFAGSILVLCALASTVRPGGQWPAGEVYFDPIVLYFLIGMLIAKIAVRHRGRRDLVVAFVALAVATTLVAVIALISGTTLDTSRSSLFTMLLLSTVFVAVVWLEPLVAHRIPRPILYMGAASYTLYLFHPMIAPIVPVVLRKLGIINDPLSVICSVILAIVVSALIYRLIEQPVTKWLSAHLPYVRSKPQGDLSQQVA